MIAPELIKFLPASDQENLRELEKVITSPGWKLIEEYFQTRHAANLQRQLDAPSWEAFNTYRGATQAFSEIVDLETTVTNLYTQLAEAAAVENLESDIDSELEYE
jgi:hypothetical protein